ncbi:inter-alpha-trypsin inhibitor heavy chain H3-like [Lissotriton helveticus]
MFSERGSVLATMNRLLLVCALLASLTAFVTSDFLIKGPGNIKKRSVAQTVTRNEVEVYSVKIDSKVTSRFSHNVITSRAVNRANTSKEIFFDVDLPKTAFITNFSMTIDGVTYPGSVKEKETAKKQYDQAVSRGQTAGLVKASGRKTEKFTVSVNVASESKVTFELIYEELLKRHLGKYELILKVKPKQLINHFEIEANIYEPQGIKSLDARGTFITNDLQEITKTSFSGNKGHVSFKPSVDQQRSCANCSTTLLDGDFTISYDVNRESPGNVQIVNGYFVHFFAPANLPTVPKNVVFVIDKSGSMYGRKMDQTKEALLKILEDIKEHDHFNFILFDDRVEPWNHSLIQATAENVEKAKAFVKTIRDQGSTNINDPLLKAIEMLNEAHERQLVPEKSASMIILLTDGEANEGETNPEKIQMNAKNAIKGKYTLYSLGFGRRVDYQFLEKLALENSGVARRIYEDSDSSLQLQGFYNEVANPLLVDVQLQYPENEISDLTQNIFKNYYDGSEIVVAGRIIDNDLNTFTAEVKGLGANTSMAFPEKINIAEREEAQKQQEYIFGDFTERLWAYLTIQQLLEKKIQAKGEEKDNITAQALDLSLKYNFVTPLTSMVVTKPEDDKKDEPLIANKPSEDAIYRTPVVFGPDPGEDHSNQEPIEEEALPSHALKHEADPVCACWNPEEADLQNVKSSYQGVKPFNTLGSFLTGAVDTMFKENELTGRWLSVEEVADEDKFYRVSKKSETNHSDANTCEEKVITAADVADQTVVSRSSIQKHYIPSPALHDDVDEIFVSGSSNLYHYILSPALYGVDSDPHFIIHVQEKNDSLCFNINEDPGVVLNLVKDPYSGITVNGELIGDKKTSNVTMSNNTYFGKIGIIFKLNDLKIQITPQKIIVRTGKEMMIFSWLDTVSITQNSVTIVITKEKEVRLFAADGATFVILLHQVWKKHPLHRDFLGFYTVDGHMLSEKTHGLLGQFFHGVDFEVFDLHQTSNPQKPDATMIVKKHKLTVTRGWQREYQNHPKVGDIVPCWFVHFNGTGLIDGVHTDYIVPSLFSAV